MRPARQRVTVLAKVDVCFGDVTWDLRPDLRVEVWR